MTLYKGTQLIAGLGKNGKDGISLICGQTIFSLDPLTNAGLHLLDGTVLPVGGSYDDFITNYIIPLYTAHPERFKTEAQWQDIVDEYGVCGYYVYTEGVSVRLPKVTGIVEGTVDVNALGSVVPESLPNITGNFRLGNIDGVCYGVNTWNTAGAFDAYQKQSQTVGQLSGSHSNMSFGVKFDANKSSSIYQNNAHVQPQTIKGYYYIVVSTVTKTDIEVDIDQIQTDLNNKVDSNSLAELDGSLGMPSTRYIDLVYTSHAWYTAPANGYVMFQIKLTATSSQRAYLASYTEQDGNLLVAFQLQAGNTTQNITMSIPVKKGQVFRAGSESTSTDSRYFRFIYAEGDKNA